MSNIPNQQNIEQRKREHVQICLHEDVTGTNIDTGLDQLKFIHNALPEINFEDIDTTTVLFNKPLRVPLLISSMTGGTDRAYEINRNLAYIAEQRGWAMGLGSLRAAVEHPELASSFAVRSAAPSVPLIANLGAVQLNYGFTAQHCLRAIELCEADAIVLHLNSLQEVFQPGGNTNFAQLLRHIERVCSELPVPVGVKEVGWGIDGETAKSLIEVGVQFIDTAGAGGTSWSQVEKHRTPNAVLREAANTFAGWGIATASSVRDVRAALPDALLIASGGLRHGLDAAKTIALGADMAGFGRSLLAPALESAEALDQLFQRLELELRIAMFGIGAANLRQLQGTRRLVQ